MKLPELDLPKPWEPLLGQLSTPVIPSEGEHPTIEELLTFVEGGELIAALSHGERLLVELSVDLFTGRDCQLNHLLNRLDTDGVLALLMAISFARTDAMLEMMARRNGRPQPEVTVIVV